MYLMLDSITGNRSNEEAVKNEDKYMTLRNGHRKLLHATRGQDLYIMQKSSEAMDPIKSSE